ncbi:MAG: rhodanese-like domain-containing protein [Luteibaculum sp.]
MENKFSLSSDMVRYLAPAEFELLIRSKPDCIVLDVRTAEEYAQYHLPNAINMDISKVDFTILSDRFDKEWTLMIYCSNGRRSQIAARYLSQMGFSVIYLLNGLGALAKIVNE